VMRLTCSRPSLVVRKTVLSDRSLA
jgi:hypothetical protein